MSENDAVAFERVLLHGQFGLEDLPVLGEPLAVEFANTLYRLSRDSTIDFLDSPQAVAVWFSFAPAAQGLGVPPRLSAATLEDLHRLRSVVIDLLDAAVDDPDVENRAVSELNGFAARAPGKLELTWAREGRSAVLTHQGDPTNVFIATLGSELITFFAGPSLESVRRCERPGCFMLFVQQHHKRRFCHKGCSHRTRQARYYRSTTTKVTRS